MGSIGPDIGPPKFAGGLYGRGILTSRKINKCPLFSNGKAGKASLAIL